MDIYLKFCSLILPTGQATVELHPFARVIGVDPSEKMLSSAREYVSGIGGLDSIVPDKYAFIQSPAESLGFIEKDSVDLVIAGRYPITIPTAHLNT